MSLRAFAVLLLVLNTISIIFFELVLTKASIKRTAFHKISLPNVSLISFIVPTFFSRKSLISTIKSIERQTVKDWKVIIGVDNGTINRSVVFKGSESVFNDSKIKVVYVNSTSSDRGACGNGAGEIRNILIRDYTTSLWAGFVDDDDTLDSYYLKFLGDALHFDSTADLIIFTMKLTSGYVVPTRRHFLKRYVLKNYVGISFAVRRTLFVSKSNSIEFKASCTEDYDLIRDAFEMGFRIIMSDCIAYHVRPVSSVRRDFNHQRQCSFQKLRRTYDTQPRRVAKYKH
jgi:hypothetical protein